jgi:hypothetical protein
VSWHNSQEVCPWNGGKFVRLTGERDFDGRERERERLRKRKREPGVRELPSTTLPSLISLMRMTQEEWDEWTQGSAIRRAGYAGLKRNVAVALGNWGSAEAVPVLERALLPRTGDRLMLFAELTGDDEFALEFQLGLRIAVVRDRLHSDLSWGGHTQRRNRRAGRTLGLHWTPPLR